MDLVISNTYGSCNLEGWNCNYKSLMTKKNNHITLEDEKEIDNQKYPINIDSS
jgi:hypothetical protein